MTEQFKAKQVLCPCCKARTFTQDAPWKKVCVTYYLERNPSKRRTPEPVVHAGAGIAPDMLKRILYLVHPDKHGNSEASNIATTYLLELRKGAAHG